MYCSTCAQETATTPCAECGADPLLEGRYRLERRLGKGTAGTTWGGVRLQDGLPVALKEVVIRREAAEELRRGLEREVSILRQLHHPSLPAFVEQFETHSGRTRSWWLVMELVEGVDLARGLDTHRYSEDQVLVVIDELCEILTYLHTLSPPVIHRDLKPGNVIRASDGRLVLVDFGSVRDALGGELGGNTVAGTFGYMAPEQFAGEASPQTDLYGLGALAVALLTREDPARLLDGAGRLQWKGRAHVSAPTAHLLDGLLAPEPAKRPASAEEVRKRIRARDLVPVAPPPRLRKAVAGVAAFAGVGAMTLGGVGTVATLGLLGVFLLSPPPNPDNFAACHAYVETFNGASCSHVELSAQELCPLVLNESPCDMTSYYQCMSDSVRCSGDFLDLSGQADCSFPHCP